MGNILSISTQKPYQIPVNTSKFQRTEHPEQNISHTRFSNEKSSLSIRNFMYQLLNQPKQNLSLLIVACAALIYEIRLKKLEVQSNNQFMEIVALKENMAACHHSNFYVQDEKYSLMHIENNSAPRKSHIQNKFLSDIIKLSSNTTLDSNDEGKYIILEEPNLHITLPSPHSVPTGYSFKFFSEFKIHTTENKPGFINVADGSKDRIILGKDNEEHSIPINSGEYVQLVADKMSNAWHAINRNAAFGSIAGFEGSLEQNGWQRLPSGLIMQWGVAPISSGIGNDVSNVIQFPRSFPKTVLSIQLSHDATAKEGKATMLFLYRKIDNTKFFARADWISDHHPVTSTSWLAIGY